MKSGFSALPAWSRVRSSLRVGGSAFRPPEDHGFMYGRSFCDPDGHVWEPFYYDASTIPEEHR